MSTVVEAAVEDLTKALKSVDGTSTRNHHKICAAMNGMHDWHVSPRNLLDTARTLGFLVIGSTIHLPE